MAIYPLVYVIGEGIGICCARTGRRFFDDAKIDMPWFFSNVARLASTPPLRRVHECVFGVLALESEPVDPRL